MIHLRFDGFCPKPYVRMTQRSKYADPQAKQYLSSKATMAMQFKAQMHGRDTIQRGQPLSVIILIQHDHGFHNRDLDNEIKAILDAAQGVVFEDDRWVDRIEAHRSRRERCSVSLLVWTL